MALKPRTFRRVILVGSLTTLILAILVGYFVVRPWQRQRGADQRRVEGLAAAQAGDHAQAVTMLGRYIRQTPNAELECYLAHARSSMKFQASDGGHIRIASQSFREYLDRVPDDVEVAKELLPLFNILGMYLEAQDLAEGLQTKYNDQSIEVIRELRFAYQKLDRNLEDIEALFVRSVDHADSDFQDIFQYVEWLRLQNRYDEVPALVQARVDAGHDGLDTRLIAFWVKDFSESGLVGRELLNAQIAEFSSILGLNPQTAQWEVEPEFFNPVIVSILDRVYNMLGRQDLSLAVRLASARIEQDTSSLLWSARRLYWSQDYDTLFELGTLNSENETIPSVLGYQILAYRQLGDAQAKDELMAQLQSITLDFRAKAWRELIQGMDLLDNSNSVDARPMIKEALENNFSEPTFHLVMGDVHIQQGRLSQAHDEWDKANSYFNGINGNLEWIEPSMRIIESYTKVNRLAEVMSYVDSLLQIAPRNPRSTMIWLGSYAQLARSNDLEYTKTQEILTRFQAGAAALSVQDQAVFSPQIATLFASIDQDEDAIRVLSSAAESSPPQGVLNELLAVDQHYQLGVFESLGIDSRDLALSSPQSALHYAFAEFTSTQSVQSGLETIEAGESQASDEDKLRWAMVRVKFLDITEDSRAIAAWKTLRAKYPKNIDLLYQFAESKALGNDPVAVDAVIDQIIELTMTQGKTPPSRLRLARASSIVSQKPTTKLKRDQALEIVRSVVAGEQENIKARNMLGRLLAMKPSPTLDPKDAFEPDIEGAISEYVTISRQLKGRGAQGYLLEAVDLSLANNNQEAARQYLFEFDSRFENDYQILPQVARRLENINDLQTAGNIYARIYQNASSARDTINSGLALSNVYISQDRGNLARSLLTDLSNEPAMNPVQLLRLVSLMAKNGNKARADQLAPAGEQYQLTAIEAKMVYAQYAGSFISGDVFDSTLREVIEIDPTHEQAWILLIRNMLQTDRTPEALELLTPAMAALPESKEIQMLSLMANGGFESASQLIDSGLVESNEFVVNMIGRVDQYMDLKEQGSSAQDLVALLTSLLDDYPRSEPLQRFALNELRTYQAVPASLLASYAERAGRFLPGDSGIMRIACNANLRSQNPTKALVMAQLWRANIHGSPMEPDVIIARSFIELENFRDASQTLEPYVQGALEKPNDRLSANVLHGYSHAQLKLGEDPQIVADRLEPLLGISGSLGKQIWLNLIADSVPTHSQAVRWIQVVTPYTTDDEQVTLAGAWLQIADRFDVQGTEETQSAIDILESQLESFPNRPGVLNVCAQAYAAQGELLKDQTRKTQAYRRSIELLDHASGIDPTNYAHLALSASFAARLEDFTLAESKYRELLGYQIDPGLFAASVLNNLAALIERQSHDPTRLTEALELSTQATDMASNSSFWGTRGWIELASSQLDQAETSFRNGINLDNGHVEGWIGLAIVQYQRGPTPSADATDSFTRALQVLNSSPMNSSLAQRVRSLGDSEWRLPNNP